MNDAPSQPPRFTLSQLLAVVTVIAIVLGIAGPLVRSATGPAAEAMWPLLVVAFFVMVLPGSVIVLAMPPLYSNRTKTATLCEALSHGLAVLGILALLYVVAPWCARIFKDFDMELPGTTILLVSMSHAAIRYPYLAIPCMIVFAAVDGIVFSFLHVERSKRAWARLWSAVITAILLGTIIFSVVALLHPLFVLVTPLTLTR